MERSVQKQHPAQLPDDRDGARDFRLPCLISPHLAFGAPDHHLQPVGHLGNVAGREHLLVRQSIPQCDERVARAVRNRVPLLDNGFRDFPVAFFTLPGY